MTVAYIVHSSGSSNDLYKQQKSLNMHLNSHPMDCPALSILFNCVKVDVNKKHQENFQYIGIGTIQHKYSSVEELIRLANYFLSSNSSASSCIGAMFLLIHFSLTRGESVRKLELADMFILDLENEGLTACKAMIVSTEQCKTNQFAPKELGVCI